MTNPYRAFTICHGLYSVLSCVLSFIVHNNTMEKRFFPFLRGGDQDSCSPERYISLFEVTQLGSGDEEQSTFCLHRPYCTAFSVTRGRQKYSYVSVGKHCHCENKVIIIANFRRFKNMVEPKCTLFINPSVLSFITEYN